MPRTVVESNTGLAVAISAVIPSTYDQAGYESTDLVYTAIGEVETVGPHGVERQIITFTPVYTGVIAKMPGSKDYGSMDVTIGNVPSDAGQVIVKASSEANAHYSVKLTYPDGEVHYLDVISYRFRYTGGGANDVDKIDAGFALTRAPVVVAAA
jgi:hypothetical protein